MVSILDGMGYTSQIPQPPSVSGNQTRNILSGVTFLAKYFCKRGYHHRYVKLLLVKANKPIPKIIVPQCHCKQLDIIGMFFVELEKVNFT